MDLKCRHGHLWGKELLVNGTTYTIGTDGYLRDVSEEHSKKLLQNSECWIVEAAPPKAKEPEPAPAAPATATEAVAPAAAPSAPPPPPAPEPEADSETKSMRRLPPTRR